MVLVDRSESMTVLSSLTIGIVVVVAPLMCFVCYMCAFCKLVDINYQGYPEFVIHGVWLHFLTFDRSDLVCRVKYNNTLPDIPFDPKFIIYPFESNRYTYMQFVLVYYQLIFKGMKQGKGGKRTTTTNKAASSSSHFKDQWTNFRTLKCRIKLYVIYKVSWELERTFCWMNFVPNFWKFLLKRRILFPSIIFRFVQYNPTSLERTYKHELLTEHDLGVTIDLINPDTYKDDMSEWLLPEPFAVAFVFST